MNYTEIVSLVSELLADSGREITVLRFKQTASDTDKPWKGPGDPRTVPDASATVNAVFLPPGGASELGLEAFDRDLLKRTSEVAIVEPGSFDFATANEILDGTVYKKLSFVKALRPADVTVLYYFGVSV